MYNYYHRRSFLIPQEFLHLFSLLGETAERSIVFEINHKLTNLTLQAKLIIMGARIVRCDLIETGRDRNITNITSAREGLKKTDRSEGKRERKRHKERNECESVFLSNKQGKLLSIRE